MTSRLATAGKMREYTLIREGDRLMNVRRPTHQEIAARAYQLHVNRGCVDGYDMDDWLQAEYELMQLPVHKIAELDPPAPAAKGRKPPRSLVQVVRSALMF
jgi:hypothetical protein